MRPVAEKCVLTRTSANQIEQRCGAKLSFEKAFVGMVAILVWPLMVPYCLFFKDRNEVAELKVVFG